MSTLQSHSIELPLDCLSPGEQRLRVGRFEGTHDQLQAFVESTWTAAYFGKMSFPIWSSAYFDWQLQSNADAVDRRLAVYDDDRLVAVLLGRSTRFRIQNAVITGANWSWLSVAESHRGLGLATKLDAARIALERNAGSELAVSYRFVGSKHSLAEKPSQRFPLKQFHSRLGFWARALDGPRLRRWNLNRTEGWLSQLAMPLMGRVRWLESNEIRLFADDDVSDCLTIARECSREHTFAIAWDHNSVKHQLAGSPIAQTVVAEHNGAVGGFVNFHILPFQAATRESVAVIDMICVNQLPFPQQRRLLKSALGLMKAQGAIVALKLRSGDVSLPLMLSTNFAPRPADSALVLQWMKQIRHVPRKSSLELLWR